MKSGMSGADWDGRYREGTTPWDKGYGAPPLEEFLDRHPVTGTVLVPGCGRGHDVRLLADRGTEPLGLDISQAAIDLASALPKTGAERYEVGDFLEDGFRLKGFDWVFEHTCFCAIHPNQRPDYVEAVRRSLKPGGHFLAIFYVNIENTESPPFPVSETEIDRLFHSFFETLESWVPGRSYPERAGRESMRLMRKRSETEGDGSIGSHPLRLR